MRIYFAGVDRHSFLPILWKAGARRVLINYYDFRNTFHNLLEHLKQYDFDILLDSGAYPAYTRGVKIDVKEYANFLKKYGEYFEGYFNLDDIESFDKTWDNQDYLESERLKPIPVYHYGEPIETLKIISRQYEFIGIGGMVPISKQKLDNWLQFVFFNKDGQEKLPGIKFHGLGLTTYDLMKKYPFYSVDSSKWLNAKRFGKHINKNGQQIRVKDARIEQPVKWHLGAEKELEKRKFQGDLRLFE